MCLVGLYLSEAGSNIFAGVIISCNVQLPYHGRHMHSIHLRSIAIQGTVLDYIIIYPPVLCLSVSSITQEIVD